MKQKLLFFHHASKIGGAGVSAVNVLDAIDKSLFDVTVFTCSVNEQMVNYFLSRGYKVIPGGLSPVSFCHCVGSELFIFSPQFIKNILSIFFDKKRIKTLLKNVNPDIVIVNSMTLFWIGRIAKKQKIRTICFVRETFIKGLVGIRTFCIKKHLRLYFDRVVFISQYDLNKCNIPINKKVLIYNMLTEENSFPYNKIEAQKLLHLPSDPFYLLYLGGMSSLKGVHVVLKSLPLLRDCNIKLVFVGYKWNGRMKKITESKSTIQKLRILLNLDFEKSCIKFILMNNLLRNIYFFDYSLDTNVFYQACDAIVIPFTKPHQARPLFEAGFAQIPAIITDFENLKEFTEDDTCFLFKNNDFRSLASIINDISDNPELTLCKIESNYQKCKTRHNLIDYKEKIKQLFVDVTC